MERLLTEKLTEKEVHNIYNAFYITLYQSDSNKYESIMRIILR